MDIIKGSSLQVVINATLDEPFIHKARWSKEKDIQVEGFHGSLYQSGQENIWGHGHYVNQDGRVGAKRASNVLLSLSDLPKDVQMAVKAEYQRLVREAFDAISTED